MIKLVSLKKKLGVSPEINMTNETCNILDEDDYYKILWTSAAEIPGNSILATALNYFFV